MNNIVYDKNKGIIIYVDPWSGTSVSYELYAQNGSSIFDTLTQLFSSSVASSVGSAGKKKLWKLQEKMRLKIEQKILERKPGI